MKIICISVFRNSNNRVNSITLNKEYEVVAVTINIEKNLMMYNLIDDLDRLAFYETTLFKISDGKIDDDWIFKQMNTNHFQMLPQVLSYESFYEDFHNDDDTAMQKFMKRYSKENTNMSKDCTNDDGNSQ